MTPATSPAIPHTRFDAGALPPEQRFERWAAYSPNTLLTQRMPRPFDARAAFWDLGPVCVTESHLDPFVSDRDEAMVARVPADHVHLVILTEGSVRFEAPGLDATIAAPGLFLRDFARVSRVTADRIRCTALFVARDFLEAALGPLRAQGPLPAGPEAAVLADVVAALLPRLSALAQRRAGTYARILRDLAAAACADMAPDTAEPGDRRGAAAYARAVAWIAARPPGALSVEEMARELGLSRSVVYRLFHRHGGVAAFDRARRLRALYYDLIDPAEGASLAELGARHGFHDKGVLARGFRALFGASPTQVRAAGRAPAPPAPPPADAAEEMRRAMHALTSPTAGPGRD